MKILLNLLPEEKKQELQRGLHGRFLLWQLFLLFFLELFFAGMLVGVSFILGYQLRTLQGIEGTLEAASRDQTAQLETFEAKFRGTNEAIDVVGRLEGQHLYFTQVFRLLDRELGEGITLREVTTKDRTAVILGVSETREELLAFEERLKASSCVEKVEVPLSNLFSERNVDFQVEATLSRECLHQNSL